MRENAYARTEDHQAALWADRLATAALSGEEAAHLQAWLSAHPRREALLTAHRDLIASAPLRRALVQVRASGARTAKPRAPVSPIWALAGAAMAAAIAVIAWPRPALDLKTPQGRQQVQVLADGSRLTLNGDSQARVTLARRKRDVRLDHGEAFFKVAHDPSRPFTVHAQDASVTALGTAFNVNRLAHATEITVHEGKVRVAAAATRDRPIVLVAGESVRVSARGIEGRAKFNPAVSDDWRSGWIELNNGRLGDLVTELNRANATRPLQLADPTLADLRLTGRFRATAPRETATLVAATHGLALRESPDGTVLARIARP